MNPIPRRVAAPFLAVSLALLGCGGAETTTKSAAAAGGARPLDVVKVSFSPTLAYAPWAIGLDAGYFREEGIDLKLVPSNANTAPIALTAGELDVVSTAIRAGLFNMMLRGSSIRIVADRGHDAGPCSPGAFAAPPAVADAIAAAGGRLHGRKFVLFRGGVTEYMVERLLKARNTPREAIELAQLPQGQYETTIGETFDAIRYMQEPTLSKMIAAGRAKIIARDGEFAPGNQHGVVLYGKRLLVDDPELGRRVMRAYLRSVRRYSEGATEENVAILARHTKLPPDLIRNACWVTIAPDGMVQFDAISDLLSWSRERGYLDGDVTRELWWNPSFIEAANRTSASAAQ